MSSNDKSKGSRNIFTLLQRYDIEFYKFNNHGHIARDCKLKASTNNTVTTKSQNTKQKKYCREKQDKESSMITLLLYVQPKAKTYGTWTVVVQNI